MLGNLKLHIPIIDGLSGAMRHLASCPLLRDGKRIVTMSNSGPKVITLDFCITPRRLHSGEVEGSYGVEVDCKGVPRKEFCGVVFCLVYCAMKTTALVQSGELSPRRSFNSKLVMHVDYDRSAIIPISWIVLSRSMQTNRVEYKQRNRVAGCYP
jgi:hypothetical protein